MLVPGDLETRTGGYGYDRRIVAGLRTLGWRVDVVGLDDSFPFPTPAARAAANRALAAIPGRGIALVDGLAYGALPDEAARHGSRLTIAALVHHPLASENGLDPATAASLEASERRALASARVLSSPAAPPRLRSVRTALRASHRGGRARDGSRAAGARFGADSRSSRFFDRRRIDRPVSLLCVATLTPRKGHELLLRALATMSDLPWRLTCAGSLSRDRGAVARVQELIREFGFGDRVALVGDLDASALAVEYDRADLFVLPTLLEGYGMSVAEALARGLPVVSTATGAIAELVDASVEPGGQMRAAAGLVVPPGDLRRFGDALRSAIADPALRDRLAAGREPPGLVCRRGKRPAPRWLAHSSAAVGDFAASWLALREPADHAARSTTLVGRVAGTLPADVVIRVLDLGSGTGSNLRFVAPRLRQPQEWLLVDRDLELLALARASAAPHAVIQTRAIDLSRTADRGVRALFDGRTLVTASALLDLVSEAFVQVLAERCRDGGAAALFALTYDGRVECTPADEADAVATQLLNAHQLRDKGFGPALGPGAAAFTARAFAARGYITERQRSDWLLGPDAGRLQRELIEGWARAAIDVAPDRAGTIDRWRERRLQHVEARRSHLRVGHQDLLALLAKPT